MPKITKEQMAEIFELRSKGVYWANLAIIFDISDTTLRRYARLAEKEGFGLWIL